MRTVKCLPLMAALTLGAIAAPAQITPQKTDDSQAAAIELLRRTLAEQQANPGKIIRATNPPPAAGSPQAAGSRAALERQYLDGKLTARQYQKTIEQWEHEQKKRVAADATKPRTIENATHQSPQNAAVKSSNARPEIQRATSPKNSATAIVTPPPGTVSPQPVPAEPTPQQKKISDVEARIDEMMRLKAAREKAALTNTATVSTNLPVTPQTRRQRLDAILKQNLDGKLSDAEYQAQRAKILAEPE